MIRIPFDEINGGRSKAGTPSPYRDMSYDDLMREQTRLILEHSRTIRELNKEVTRRIETKCFDPVPLHVLRAGAGDEGEKD